MMIKNISHFHKGFNLIEMLLVLVIISLLSLIGVSVYRQKSSQGKVELAAQEMRMILEGARRYYVDTNQWPASATTTSIDPSFAPYLNLKLTSSSSVLNPWGYAYTLVVDSSGMNRKLGVLAQTPDDQTAAQLASSLPLGQTVNTPVGAISYAIFPGNMPVYTANKNFKILSSGRVTYVADKPYTQNLGTPCPENWWNYIAAGMSSINASVYTDGPGVKLVHEFGYTQQTTYHTYDAIFLSYSFKAAHNHKDKTFVDDGLMGTSNHYDYIIFCLKK